MVSKVIFDGHIAKGLVQLTSDSTIVYSIENGDFLLSHEIDSYNVLHMDDLGYLETSQDLSSYNFYFYCFKGETKGKTKGRTPQNQVRQVFPILPFGPSFEMDGKNK